MDDNIFFKWVWRFNALIISGVVFVTLLIAVPELIRDVNRPPYVSDVVNIDSADASIEETINLRTGELMRHHKLVTVSISKEQHYDYGYSGKSTGNNDLNMGVFDPDTGQTTWIFDGTDQLIIQTIRLYQDQPVQDYASDQAVTRFHLLIVVEADTNGDKRLSGSDVKSAWLVNHDGTGARKIIDDLRNGAVTRQISEKQVMLSYRVQDTLYAAQLDTETGQILRTDTITLP